MRILLDLSILRTRAARGGLGRWVQTLAEHLHRAAQNGAELDVLGTLELPVVATPRVSEDIPALLAEARLSAPLGPSQWASGVRLGLGRAVGRARASVVHTPDHRATPLTKLRVPRVITCHHLEPEADSGYLRPDLSERRRIDIRRFVRTEAIMVPSRATAHSLISQLDVSREKIHIVPGALSGDNWVATAQPSDAAELAALGISEQAFLLAVGTATHRKNPEGIIDALSRARKMAPQLDLHLVWAGDLEPEERDVLTALAKDKELSEKILRVGRVLDSTLAALYRRARVLLLPSRYEGFGYSALEAMACGCPVIVGDRSSLPEVTGGAAWLVQPEDPAAIADAVLLVSLHGKTRDDLVKQGLAQAAQYTGARMAQSALRVYELTLSSPSIRPSGGGAVR